MEEKSTISKINNIQEEKRRLIIICLLLGSLLLIISALLIGFISFSKNTEYWNDVLAPWLNDLFIGISASILTFTFLAIFFRLFNIGETQSSRVIKINEAGILKIIPKWIVGKPSNKILFQKFQNSEVVHLLGVTLYNSLIGVEWFSDQLSKRIKNKNMDTRILLMDPNCSEIERRENERSGRQISHRGSSSIKIITKGLKEAGLSEKERVDYFRTFEFSPNVNFLRFDDVAYIVLFQYGKGGQSPALVLSQTGWLFNTYCEQFTDIWNDLSSSFQE